MNTREGVTSRHTMTRVVPQWGILSPVLFNTTVIDLTESLPSTVRLTLYADYVCLWAFASSPKLIPAHFEDALSKISQLRIIRGLEQSQQLWPLKG